MTFKAQKIEVPEYNPFANDKLASKTYVNNFNLLLENISSPMVLSVNAPWGHGKTTFLEMLNANLKTQNKKTVLFSAWETDFVDDPLLAFLGEINTEISDLTKENEAKSEAWSKAKKTGIHIVKTGIPALVKVATAGIIDAEKMLEDEASKLAEGLTKDAIDVYSKEKEKIKEFKDSIKSIFGDEKLYIFIDELDRCRPNYAIEFLERIKHLLGVDGLVFILAMDKIQLSHSIKAVYGNDFDALAYLRRFIDIEYSLPKRELNEFIESLCDTFNFDNFFEKRKNYQNFTNERTYLCNTLKLLAESESLSLRDIEQLFSKINLIINSTKENIFLHPTLLALLLVTKEYYPEAYKNYIKESSSPEELINLLYEIIPKSVRLQSHDCAFLEAHLIRAKSKDLANECHSLLKTHNEIANDSKSSVDAKEYSSNVVHFCEYYSSPINRGIDLKSLVSRIELLENFNFSVS